MAGGRALEPARLQAIAAARLRERVTWLADDQRRGRPTPSPELDEAARYVAKAFDELGLVAPEGAPGYEQRFECGGPDHPGLASNVIARLPGRDPELAEQVVIVSAHYDHIGDGADGDDPIYNGANDDASGVAAMLSIAEALAASPPRRSVLFIAFCGEERGLRGSQHYAEHPLLPLDRVVAQINLEMLGRPPAATEGAPIEAWIPGLDHSDLGAWLDESTRDSGVRFVDGRVVGRVEGAAFHRADHYPLAMQGVVAHTIASGPLDALYHSPDDEAEGLDYERMAVVVRAIARAVHRLAEADGRPQRLEPPPATTQMHDGE